jgi:fructokinase
VGQVICLGEVLVDRLADQVAPTIADVQSWTDYPGGAPANVACALRQLGTRASFVGAIGADKTGQELAALLHDRGVAIRGIQTITTHPTRTVLVLRSADGDRHFAGFGDRHDTTEFADTQIQAAAIPPDLFTAAQFLVLGTLGLATSGSAGAIARAISLAQANSLQILLDVNWRPVFWPEPEVAPAMIRQLIHQVDWLKLSIDESQWLFQTDDPAAIVARFPQLKGVCITLGREGCNYWLQGNSGHIPAFTVTVQDTTGAGDGFVAGWVHQLCQLAAMDAIDADLINPDLINPDLINPVQAANIVTYACAVGALMTLQNGAIGPQPTADQIVALIQGK